MAIIATGSESRPKFPPLESGSYIATCYGMVVTGTEYNKMFGNYNLKVCLLWELPTERIEVDGKDLPRGISKFYTVSLGDKANLRKDLESWRGKTFTEDEIRNGFDISKVVGASCMLSIVEDKGNDGNIYNKITAVSKLPAQMPPMPQENETLIFDIRNADEYPVSLIEKMPKWLQERVKKSAEYGAREVKDTDPIDSPQDLPF